MNRNKVCALGRKLRLGLIGGGPGSFIGPVHRGSALLHEQYDIVASVLSSNPERSVLAGQQLGISRPYATEFDLFEAEKNHAEPIDVLAIITPNNTHYELSVKALECGFHVMCEKPLTNTLENAMDLAKRAEAANRHFYVAYAYTGYSMVRQARAMMAAGMLGDLRMVQCEYVQGHLAELTQAEKDKTNWHMNPEIVGPSLILGDIATHSYHLASFITGTLPSEINADVATVVPGRVADDYCAIMSRYANGARGMFWVTQAGAGAVHGLQIRVFGSKGSLEWVQETPDTLVFRPIDGVAQLFSKGGLGLLPEAAYSGHIAIGHPEGYREAFANLYLDLSENIVAQKQQQTANPLASHSPTIKDGVDGIAFIKTCLKSSNNNGTWEPIPLTS